MSTKSEILTKASKVSQVKSDFSAENTQCSRLVDGSSTWWQGEAGKNARIAYKDIAAEIKTLLRRMGDMHSDLKRLADKVERAEQEKKDREAKANTATGARR